MLKHLAFAAAVVVAVVLCCWLAFCAPRTEAGPPMSDLVDVQAWEGGRLGDNEQYIGQLAEPVTARVLVYDANSERPTLWKVQIAPGIWLVPESMLSRPE